MKRAKTTGQFTKPIYELYVHDFSEMGVQLVEVSEDKQALDKMSEALNNLFIQGRVNKRFEAGVHESNETSGE